LQKKVLVNHQIKAREVRVVDEEGRQMGVMSLEKALKTARERGLDLVQVTERVSPPVCKIIDFGKYLYQLKKKEKSRKQKVSEVKGIRLRFNTSLHDLETKAKQAKGFLEKGNKIKIEMILRGREKALMNHAREKMNKFLEILSAYIPIEIDQEIKKGSRGLGLIIKKGKHEGKNQEITS
jgi:translation initiation factor IF-3